MFVALYRWRLKSGREREFTRSWEAVTEAIRRDCGSHGSALFRGDDGRYWAIAIWPDRETRERCSPAVETELARMTDCIEERFPEERLETISNLWGVRGASGR